MSESKFIENVAQDARYFPTLIGVFVLGLLLLFFKELGDPVKQYLIPSLVIYVLGTSFLGYWQSMLAWREELKHEATKEALKKEDEKKGDSLAQNSIADVELKDEGAKKGDVFIGTRPKTFRAIIVLHVLWFFIFVTYNIYRRCL